MRRKKNVTFDDIAKYTGFSKTTISRYFNNPDSLTLENQDTIAKALDDLDYKENKVARILANGKTEFVGIIISNLTNHYYSEMLNQLLLTYEDFGYKFLVFVGKDDEEAVRRYLQELLAYNIEGLIVISQTLSSKELADLHIPIVSIERENQYICSVDTDNYMGGVQATSLLVKKNCDVLIHVNSPTSPNFPTYGRIRGFLDICKEAGIRHKIICKNFRDTFEAIKKDLTEVLEEIEGIEGKRKGIFISNDTHANIFLNLCIQKYGAFPDEYFLIGFDDSPISREAVIPISTVGQQIQKIAQEAMSLLVSQMNEQKKRRPVPLAEPIHKVVTPILIHRDTTEKDSL